ncbi:superoxide dismutase family protein [Streptomyces sp. NPDC001941]|uniref:superoxide dismutase family protein n=1 Tax=Streptomyces sp. NPDC001941 TaxID=3154659 RepID=UPI003328DC38
MRKTVSGVCGALLALGAVAGCSIGGDTPDGPGAAATPGPTSGGVSRAPGPEGSASVLKAPHTYGNQPEAVSYDPASAPLGGGISASRKRTATGTVVTLSVTGLLPGHAYGAHVHTKPCGARPADAGPHYQHTKDPVTPSVDPAFANSRNEIWLDLTTDASGAGTATATVDWSFRPGEANAVVLHAAHTSTMPGMAGTAGNRLACLTSAF